MMVFLMVELRAVELGDTMVESMVSKMAVLLAVPMVGKKVVLLVAL